MSQAQELLSGEEAPPPLAGSAAVAQLITLDENRVNRATSSKNPRSFRGQPLLFIVADGIEDVLGADLGHAQEPGAGGDLLERGDHEFRISQRVVVQIHLDPQQLLRESERIVLDAVFERLDMLLDAGDSLEQVSEVSSRLLKRVIELNYVLFTSVLVAERLLAEICHLLVTLEIAGAEVIQLRRQGKKLPGGGLRELQRARIRRLVELARLKCARAVRVDADREVFGD